jgi:membrane protein YqaA with SNARE-associated domain
MGEFVGRIRSLALALGGPGLFLVAFLDSTFLPLPGITDLLLIVMVTRHPSAMPGYVVATVAGSLAGCLVMHAIGKKGGEALVRKRFAGARVERAMASLRRHGMVAVLVPSLLPPPAPFKLFVLLAGVVGISRGRFAVAITIGRGARYVALGLLAVRYGEAAMRYVRENGALVSLVAAGIVAAAFAGSLLWRKARTS